jgi:hypothetical protein
MLAMGCFEAQEGKRCARLTEGFRIGGNYEIYSYVSNARSLWGRARIVAVDGGNCRSIFRYYVAGEKRVEVSCGKLRFFAESCHIFCQEYILFSTRCLLLKACDALNEPEAA